MLDNLQSNLQSNLHSLQNSLQNNYTTLKVNMRKVLKTDLSTEQLVYINRQLESFNETLEDANNKTLDMNVIQRIDSINNIFMPYILGAWMLTDNSIVDNININNIEPIEVNNEEIEGIEEYGSA